MNPLSVRYSVLDRRVDALLFMLTGCTQGWYLFDYWKSQFGGKEVVRQTICRGGRVSFELP
jgi:hypothetical protein